MLAGKQLCKHSVRFQEMLTEQPACSAWGLFDLFMFHYVIGELPDGITWEGVEDCYAHGPFFARNYFLKRKRSQFPSIQ